MIRISHLIILGAGLLCLNSSCNTQIETAEQPVSTSVDVHSFVQSDSAIVKHLNLEIEVDFAAKNITGVAQWEIIYPYERASQIVFDINDLAIDSVLDDRNKALPFSISEPQEYIGSALSVQLSEKLPGTIKIYYKTGTATALQWLAPSQTFGKKYPFLYTQSEPVYARSWIPCQDSPGIRFTYNAKVKVPNELLALMSATNPQQKNGTGVYEFVMDKAIPAYLMALAVGDVQFASLGDKVGVYAEPNMLKDAVYEFEDVSKMIPITEQLYGPYDWGRYDIIVLPSGFPIGGMENPKLTFCTPTILAGDKSLVNLIAHELAHSWSGNLVTNASWNDFWLNEGFTVYIERRITEAMYGKDYVDMLWELSYQDLSKTIAEMKDFPKDTYLKLDLKGRDPEIGLTDIAYEKGAYFLLMMEQVVGRKKFDQFLNQYFEEFSFKTINTEQFINYLNTTLLKDPSYGKAINYKEWIYGAGIPANCPKPERVRFDRIDEEMKRFDDSRNITELKTNEWSTYEWMYFLRNSRHEATYSWMEHLDEVFNLSESKNSEIAALWFQLAIHAKYKPAEQAMINFLSITGRQKFLEPIYKTLMETEEGKLLALSIFNKYKDNYHPLAQSNIQIILDGGNKF